MISETAVMQSLCTLCNGTRSVRIVMVLVQTGVQEGAIIATVLV